MNEIQKGAVVQLKSGGPRMTYTGQKGGNGVLKCQWFAGTELKDGWFPPESLEVQKE